MSVWSRSHSDLAKLAKTLQDSNTRARRRLSLTGSRTRSLSPKTHLSKAEEEAEQLNGVKTGSAHDVLLDHSSFRSDSAVVNRRWDSVHDRTSSSPTTPRVNVTSVDGSESCYSDVFLQSSASDCSEVFHALTSTADVGLCQSIDAPTARNADASPSAITSVKSKPLKPHHIFTFNGSLDNKSPETDAAAQPNTVFRSLDSGIGMGGFQEGLEGKTSSVSSGVPAHDPTNSNEKMAYLGDQGARLQNNHLCVKVDPSSPRLSVRSPDLLKKLKEVTSSISANKSTQKMKSRQNEGQLLLEMNSFSPATNENSALVADSGAVSSEKNSEHSALVANSGAVSSEKDKPILVEGHKRPSSGTEGSFLADQPDESKSDLSQTERRKEPTVCENTLEKTTLHHSASENSSILVNKSLVSACSEGVDSVLLEKDEGDCMQSGNRSVLNEYSPGSCDGEQTSNVQKSCQPETSVGLEVTDTMDGQINSNDELCSSRSDSACLSCMTSVSSPLKNSTPSAPESLLQQTILNSYTDPIPPVAASTVSVSQPVISRQTLFNTTHQPLTISSEILTSTNSVAISSQTLATTNSTTCIVLPPLSVSCADQHLTANNDLNAVGTAMPVSSGSSQFMIHDMDLRLVPLSSIGIMVGANGSKYELNERLSCLPVQIPRNTVVTTGQTDTLTEKAAHPLCAVTAASPPRSHSKDGYETGMGKVVAASSHLHVAEQSHCISSATPCSDSVAAQENTAVVSCDPSAQQDWVKDSPDEEQFEQTALGAQKEELKMPITDMGAENPAVHEESLLGVCPSFPTVDTADSSPLGQPDQTTTDTQRVEMKSDTTHLDTAVSLGDSCPSSRLCCSDISDSHNPLHHVTMETQTMEMKFNVTSCMVGVVSSNSSSFSRPDTPDVHGACRNQPNHVTAETQTTEMETDLTSLCADFPSSASSSLSSILQSYLSDCHNQPDFITTETQTVTTNFAAHALTGNSSHNSITFSRADVLDILDSHSVLNHMSIETPTEELNSNVTSSGIENSFGDDLSSCSSPECPESSNHHLSKIKQSDETCTGAMRKPDSVSEKEVGLVDSRMSSNLHQGYCEGSGFVSEMKSDFSQIDPETDHKSSKELQREHAKTGKERKDAVTDVSVISGVQQTDRMTDKTVSASQFVACCVPTPTAKDKSYSSDDGGSLLDSHVSQRSHCAQSQQNHKTMTGEPPPLSGTATSVSLNANSLSSTKPLTQNLQATGISEPSLPGLLSSASSQSLGQARRKKRHEKLESESETERSVVSASVQVSLSGTNEHRSRSSRSYKRRARAREEGSVTENGDLGQSQTSYSSSSVDSLLSLSDNGSGSGYCSDVLNYLTSSSHSQGQVSRRRLRKLLNLLQLSDQSATTEVSGLSEFSRNVADLKSLCLFLSRNLELQTRQQLLDQQQQQLREQQLLKERGSQAQESQQEKKQFESKERFEEPQLQREFNQQKLSQAQQVPLQEHQEQERQEEKEGEQISQKEHGTSDRQLVKDHPQTKPFLKLRFPDQTSQKGGFRPRPPKKTRPRTEEPRESPKPEVHLQQRSSRFKALRALSTADVHPEVLIEEACKNTELLERLGVDTEIFRSGKEECPPETAPGPLTTPEPSPRDEERQTVVGETEGGGGGAVDPVEMETPEEAVLKLDEEFDKMLADMKPHVLKLPHKSDRQKCAVWIKKLCEPPSSGITGRKNRNMYCQLMLHMLKRGSLQDPFDRKPQEGPLQPLPSYMSIYFDEPLEKPEDDTEKLPDWVEGELGESVGSSLFRRSGSMGEGGLGNPAATSTWVSNAGSSMHRGGSGVRQRPHTSMGITLDKDPGLSPIRGDHRQHTGYSTEDVRVEMKTSPPHGGSPSDRERRQLPDVRANHGSSDTKQSDMEWTHPLGVTASSTTSFAKGTLYHDETSLAKPGDKEIVLRTKMIEAKYHEEKLRLQQKHDGAVQKILDRKNSEIEDVKSHYRSKTKELEETITKLERKVQTLVKEAGVMRETKDKQITELKKMVEDSNESQRNEYEKRIHDLEADFEQQKFELQKLHTRNIQEILDDTNARLQRMDAEYNQQAVSTANVIKDLESRVQQLMGEVDRTLSQRSLLEKEKSELQNSVERLSTDLEEQRHRNNQLEREHQKKLEASEHEMRTLRNKTEASLEFLKQEHSIAAAKALDSISDLDQQVEYLKKALKDAEEHRQRQMRETEQVHQQDKLHLENLHDKQIRNMKKELEQLEQEMQRKLSRLEQLLHDKEGEVQKQKEAGREQAGQAEKALEEFKVQVEKNQSSIYADMRQQMEQVEVDLKKSKQAREKQSREYSRQLDEMKYKHEHELTEMKMNQDNEKAQLLHEVHLQKEYAASEHEREMEQLREASRNEIRAIESRFKERQEKDAKVVNELEGQVGGLREDLVQSNQLRKQQLVELGLLREEEKQKMQRDHEAEIGRIRAEGEQQRLELQKMHSTETEKLLEKTNDRLKSIEREYMDRGKKSSETITELQNAIKLLRDDIKRAKEASEDCVSDVRSQSEEEKLSLKKQYSSNLSMVQHELESQRSRCHNLDRQIQKLEADHEEKVTRLKLEHEERVRGMLPGEMKMELEDTISSLKSQVSTLQQRAAMLQEELDIRLKTPLGPFPPCTTSPIKSSV